MDPLTLDETVSAASTRWRATPCSRSAWSTPRSWSTMRARPARCADAVAGCDLVVADGQSVVWASRVLRRPAARAGGRHRPVPAPARRGGDARAARSTSSAPSTRCWREMLRRIGRPLPRPAGRRQPQRLLRRRRAPADRRRDRGQRRRPALPRHDLAEEGDLRRRLRQQQPAPASCTASAGPSTCWPAWSSGPPVLAAVGHGVALPRAPGAAPARPALPDHQRRLPPWRRGNVLSRPHPVDRRRRRTEEVH